MKSQDSYLNDHKNLNYVAPIGIMGAMDSEINLLKGCIEDRSEQIISKNKYYTGTLEGKSVVLVRSGIGKVNAAITTQILINMFNVKQIIFTGVAGGLHSSLNIQDVVIPTHLFQHDYDTTPLGDELAYVPGSEEGRFLSDNALVELAYEAACDEIGQNCVHKGVIVSGDQFIASKKNALKLVEKFDAWAVEMEGAAMAHAATLASVPFVVIRAISDKANGDAPENFVTFVEAAAQQSEKIIRNLLPKLSNKQPE